MLHELRKVIPSFLRRVDMPERGVRWSNYLATTRQRTAELVDSLFAEQPAEQSPTVTLIDFDPQAEDKLLAAICYPHSHLPEHQLLDRVARLGAAERLALMRAYVASGTTAGTSLGGRSSGSTTASTCCRTTAHSVTCNATGC